MSRKNPRDEAEQPCRGDSNDEEGFEVDPLFSVWCWPCQYRSHHTSPTTCLSTVTKDDIPDPKPDPAPPRVFKVPSMTRFVHPSLRSALDCEFFSLYSLQLPLAQDRRLRTSTQPLFWKTTPHANLVSTLCHQTFLHYNHFFRQHRVGRNQPPLPCGIGCKGRDHSWGLWRGFEASFGGEWDCSHVPEQEGTWVH